jgi:hypothetical protein
LYYRTQLKMIALLETGKDFSLQGSQVIEGIKSLNEIYPDVQFCFYFCRLENRFIYLIIRINLIGRDKFVSEITDFAHHLSEKLADLPPLKIKHFAALAKTLDASEMKDFSPVKRIAVIVCLIHRAKIKNREALAEMFIKRMMKFHQTAKANFGKTANCQSRQYRKTFAHVY